MFQRIILGYHQIIAAEYSCHDFVNLATELAISLAPVRLFEGIQKKIEGLIEDSQTLLHGHVVTICCVPVLYVT